MTPPAAFVPAHGFKLSRLARALAVGLGAQAVVVGGFLAGGLVVARSPMAETAAMRVLLVVVIAELVVASYCLGVAIASLIRMDLGRALGMLIAGLGPLIAYGYVGGPT